MVGRSLAVAHTAAAVARSRAPVRLIACHVPPTPWPFHWPGLVSPPKRYTGQPCSVSCQAPSGRRILPTILAEIPFSVGWPRQSTGGHFSAHTPLQNDADRGLPRSLSKR